MIEAILPSEVAVVEAFEDLPDVQLFDEEAAVVSRAVDKRRREFTTGRACARRALAGLGRPPVAIPIGQRGEPLWPQGVVGSITHCDGYRACAVAESGTISALGIDAEPHAPLPAGVLALIALPRELAQLRELARAVPELHWDRLIFSAKEAVFKAWFPLTHRWLGFEQAVVVIDPDGDTFTARLIAPAVTHDGRRIDSFAGRWRVRDGLVVTAIALRR